MAVSSKVHTFFVYLRCCAETRAALQTDLAGTPACRAKAVRLLVMLATTERITRSRLLWTVQCKDYESQVRTGIMT
jgi:hypothetical protein